MERLKVSVVGARCSEALQVVDPHLQGVALALKIKRSLLLLLLSFSSKLCVGVHPAAHHAVPLVRRLNEGIQQFSALDGRITQWQAVSV